MKLPCGPVSATTKQRSLPSLGASRGLARLCGRRTQTAGRVAARLPALPQARCSPCTDPLCGAGKLNGWPPTERKREQERGKNAR